MDWIEEHDCPDLDFAHFNFPDDPIARCIVVSRQRPDAYTLEDDPVDTWHRVKPTQQRLTCLPWAWYACIKGVFYWMTC